MRSPQTCPIAVDSIPLVINLENPTFKSWNILLGFHISGHLPIVMNGTRTRVTVVTLYYD